LLLAAVMVGWLLVVSGLAGMSRSGVASVLQPVDIGRGVKVTPAPGWTSGAEVWDVGPSGVSFKKAGTLVAFTAEEWTGSLSELVTRELDGLRAELGAFRALPTTETQVGDGVRALSVLFSGTLEDRRVEGELVVAVSAGTGVVMLAVAPFGQLVGIQSDLDDMSRGLVMAR